MYRIAICDDDPIFLQDCAETAADILKREGLAEETFQVSTFTSTAPLKEEFQLDSQAFCLLLLDIQLKGENGLEFAKLLRAEQNDCGLVYVTSYREYVFDSFDTHPVQYLLKPLDREKLAETLRYDLRNHLSQDLLLSAPGKQLTVPLREIYAVEANQHRVRILLQDRQEPWNTTLIEMEKLLPAQSFCRCHNSYLISLSHLRRLVRYEAQMDNGMVVPVSKRLLLSVRQKHIDFLNP